MDLAPGTLIASRYRVSKAVGSGATGTVYRAHDLLLGGKVALKVLRDDIAAKPARVRRWVRLARRVSHPNVCCIHDYVEDGPWRVLVMEYVKGCDLRRLIRRRGRLSRELGFEIAIQAAQGLEAIHAAGIVHGDLTARNVLYDVAGCVKLTDVGFAARLRPRSRRFAGKPEYMSPEQARGERAEARSDLYTLGILLFELLTGSPPFRGATRQATLRKQMDESPPLAGRRAIRVPSRLLPVLEKVLRKKPQDRYASAERLAAALRAARSASEVVVLEPGPVPWELTSDADPVPWLEEARLLPRAAVAMVASVAVVAVVAGGAWLATRSRAPGTATGLPVAQVTPPPVEPSMPLEAARPSAGEPAAAPRREARAPRPALPAETLAPAVAVEPVSEEAITPVSAEPGGEGAADEAEHGSAGPTDEPGRLQIGVRPWAAVTIDGRQLGETPMAPLALAPGVHTARLDHPWYQPLFRKVTVNPGETVRLQVDLGLDAIRRGDASAQRRE